MSYHPTNLFRMLLAVLVLILSCSLPAAAADPTGKISVLVAASLTDLFNQAKQEFEQKYPGTEVLIEPGGSLTLIRKISDLNAEADVIVVADRTLIPTHLVPNHAVRSTDFLTEKISIIIGKNAKHADQITSDNWMEIIVKPDVEFGISNPDTAPVGYRALMVWKLAEKHYQRPGLFQQLSERLPKKNIRANAVALLTLLQSGELDYIFDYPSLANQHGLRVLELPAQINLGNPAFAENYAAVAVEIPGAEPGSKKTIAGSPIVYSIAQLKQAPNPNGAQAFINFLLQSQGQALMARLGMTPIEQK